MRAQDTSPLGMFFFSYFLFITILTSIKETQIPTSSPPSATAATAAETVAAAVLAGA